MKNKLLVIAGPNGSGKSTVTSELDLSDFYYVNADIIEKELKNVIEGFSSLDAAKNAEETLNSLLSHNENIAFETVLSTDRKIKFMKNAKANGYSVACIYILTHNPGVNIERVKQRVEMGGHPVSEEKIISRYFRCLKLLPCIFNICDEVHVYDNSTDRNSGNAKRIISFVQGGFEIYPNEIWSLEKIRSLLSGTYGEKYLGHIYTS
ncbi:MAG: zeta toxin family protein [Clostridia bacterium]|nr:zeta toxin family protein [Clostridia bacterium]